MLKLTAPRIAAALLLATTAVGATVVPAATPTGADVVSGAVSQTPDVVETVVVDSRSRGGASSVLPLVAGTTYLLRVRGTYAFDKVLGGFADAECSWTPDDPTPRRSRSETFGEGFHDLAIDGAIVEWVPRVPDPQGCSEDNTYELVLRPTKTQRVNFVVADTSFTNNEGALTVDIFAAHEPTPDTVEVEAVTVSSRSARGTTTSASLVAGARYKLTAVGTYTSDPKFPRSHDAECTSHLGSPGLRDVYSGVVSPTNIEDDTFDLIVNGKQVDWAPTKLAPSGCNDEDHTYDVVLSPRADGPVNLRIDDPFPIDNRGELTVVIERIIDAEGDEPALRLGDTVMVDSRSGSPTFSRLPVVEGETYVITATGTYDWDSGLQTTADAECTSLDDLDPTALRHRYGVGDADLLDLLVNESTLEWDPTVPDVNGCNTTNRAYRTVYTAPATGLLSFRVNDPAPRDNSGMLRVDVQLADGVLVGIVAVNPRDPGGVVTPPVLEGERYLLVAEGSYAAAFPSEWEADAECTKDPGGVFEPQRNLSARHPNDDVLDLYVDRRQVTWQPATGTEPCDPDHRYRHRFQATSTGVVSLAVFDTIPGDNVGILTVQMFKLP